MAGKCSSLVVAMRTHGVGRPSLVEFGWAMKAVKDMGQQMGYRSLEWTGRKKPYT